MTVLPMWHTTKVLPARGRRIIALYNDGSAGNVFYVEEDGTLLNERGSDDIGGSFEATYSHWTYLPAGYHLFFERSDN